MKREKMILSALLIAAVLSGCGSTASTGGNASGEAVNSYKSGQETISLAEEEESTGGEVTDGVDTISGSVQGEAESVRPEDGEDQDNTTEVSGGSDWLNGSATIEETVLADEKNVKLTVSNLSYGSSRTTMNLLIENNSSEDLSFISGSLGYSHNSVNGYQISSAYVNEDVTAGNKVNTDISIRNEELEALGITEIAELELAFQVEDKDYNTYLETGPVKIETSGAASFDPAKDTYQDAVTNGTVGRLSDAELTFFNSDSYYSSHGVELISAAVYKTGESQAILLELSNSSDGIRNFRIGDVALNRLVLSTNGWDSISLSPGNRGVIILDVSNMADADEYEKFGIGDIAEIAFHAELMDENYDELDGEELVTIPVSDAAPSADESGEELYNSNGIRILYKGTSDDSLYHYLLLTVINNSSETLYVDEEYSSTSVNGFMVGESMYSRIIEPGQAGGVEYGISLSDLEGNGIDPDEIKTVSFQLNLANGSFYNYIDQPKLTVSYE